MSYAWDQLAAEAKSLLVDAGLPAELVELTEPNPRIRADAVIALFQAARALNSSPTALATAISGTVAGRQKSLLKAIDASGPYLNLTINYGHFAGQVLADVRRLGDAYGNARPPIDATIVIDYSSPNVAKRMHVGHIRSTIIGQALVNIFRSLGYRIIGDNHIGDWGKSFGVLLTGLEREGYPTGAQEQLLEQLEGLYARTSALAQEDPAIDQEAREWSLRLEQGDAVARDLWQRAVKLTIEANEPNYARLGVKFDLVHGESFYEPLLADVIRDAFERGVAHYGEGGAVVVDLGGDLPTFLLQRADGGTLYHTRDLATIKYRVDTYLPAKILYVIGEPQSLYLRQLFALSDRLGYTENAELVHVAFGTVFDASGQPLSTRRGNMVYLQTLLDQAHTRALSIVDDAARDIAPEERSSIAEAVGVGAVIYNDLHQDPRRNIILNWEHMLALDGDSAPYIQYMVARCRSILRRVEADAAVLPQPDTLICPTEHELIKAIAKLPLAIRAAGATYTPSDVAHWCYTTARAFAAFYRDCPVLGAESAPLRAARIELTRATAQALENGLRVLGIQSPSRL